MLHHLVHHRPAFTGLLHPVPRRAPWPCLTQSPQAPHINFKPEIPVISHCPVLRSRGHRRFFERWLRILFSAFTAPSLFIIHDVVIAWLVSPVYIYTLVKSLSFSLKRARNNCVDFVSHLQQLTIYRLLPLTNPFNSFHKNVDKREAFDCQIQNRQGTN